MESAMNMFSRAWGSGKRVSQEEVVELTNQFYVTLRAYFVKIQQDPNIRNTRALERIEQLLDAQKSPQNWTNAYEVEQLLVHLYDDRTLSTELTTRLLEAKSVLRPELVAMFDAQLHEIDTTPVSGERIDPAAASERKRTLLSRLINDLQWRYIVNEATRRYTKLITRRTSLLSFFALLTFIIVVVFVWRRDSFSYGDLDLLWVAGLAGTWGATFSMLVTLKSRLADAKFDDLKLMRAGPVLLSRAAIGTGAACILFFFLLSGLLGGSAFPSISAPREPTAAVNAPSTTNGVQTTGTQPGGASNAPSGGTGAATGGAASGSSPAPSPPGRATGPTAPGGSSAAGAGSPALPTTEPGRGTGTATTPPPPGSAPGAGSPASGTAPSPPARAPGSATPSSAPGTSTGAAGTNAQPPAPLPPPTSGSTPQNSALPEAHNLPPRELAMLIVWCFIAGFSEQLIPGLLASTEARASGSAPGARPVSGTTNVPPAAPAAPMVPVGPAGAPKPPGGQADGGAGKKPED
jgi:hypothetical protein